MVEWSSCAGACGEGLLSEEVVTAIDLAEGDRASRPNPLGSMRSDSASRAQCKLEVYFYDRGALEIARGQRRYMSEQTHAQGCRW